MSGAAPPAADAALLDLEGVRIDVEGAAVLDGVGAQSHAGRLALVGRWYGLFALLAGRGTLVRGTARLLGRDLADGVPHGLLGVALADPPALPDTTGAEYLALGALVGGAGRRIAHAMARESLLRLGLGSLGARRIAALALPERRALEIALATLGDPPVLALEEPLGGLDAHASAYVDTVVERAVAGRRAIVSGRELLGAERALAARADQIWLLHGRDGLVACSPAELDRPGRSLQITVARNGAELVARLAEAGVEVRPLPGAAVDAPSRFVAALPEGTGTEALLDASLAVDAPLIEMLPLTS